MESDTLSRVDDMLAKIPNVTSELVTKNKEYDRSQVKGLLAGAQPGFAISDRRNLRREVDKWLKVHWYAGRRRPEERRDQGRTLEDRRVYAHQRRDLPRERASWGVVPVAHGS